ncbi:MAG: hypothetical protein ACRD1C_03745 [Terriglobales bacterium]
MARGDKGTYNQQEQQAFANANTAAQQGQANENAAFTPAMTGYEGELANPGYTAEEQQAMTQAEQGSLAGAFGAARTRENNAASRTGNTAGVNDTNEELAREQGQQEAQAEGSLQQAFGNARIAGTNTALGGMSNLYRGATSAANGGLSSSNSLVGTQGRVATTPGFWGKVMGNVLEGIGRG